MSWRGRWVFRRLMSSLATANRRSSRSGTPSRSVSRMRCVRPFFRRQDEKTKSSPGTHRFGAHGDRNPVNRTGCQRVSAPGARRMGQGKAGIFHTGNALPECREGSRVKSSCHADRRSGEEVDGGVMKTLIITLLLLATAAPVLAQQNAKDAAREKKLTADFQDYKTKTIATLKRHF